MKTAATKERSFFSLAAFVLLAAALLAPSVEASRYLPNALAPSEAASAPLLEVDQVDAEAFPLFSETDVRLINALAFLDASEAARLSAQKRLRPIADLDEIARPAELAAIEKLASGVSTCGSETNVWQTGGLSQNCGSPSFQGLWTDPVTGLSYARNRWYDSRTASWLSEDPKGDVDSPNLYAFVGWGPHMGTDPMGLATDYNLPPASTMKSKPRRPGEEIDFWCEREPEACEAFRRKVLGFGKALVYADEYSEVVNTFRDDRAPLSEKLMAGGIFLLATADLAGNLVTGGGEGAVVKGGTTVAREISEEVVERAGREIVEGLIGFADEGEFAIRSSLKLDGPAPRGVAELGEDLDEFVVTWTHMGDEAERAGKATLERAGYEFLDVKLPGNQGFDNVAIKRQNGEIVDIIIDESKWRRAEGLPEFPSTRAGNQMSWDWIQGTISRMQSHKGTHLEFYGDILQEFLDQNRIRRKVNVFDPNTGNNRWYILDPP